MNVWRCASTNVAGPPPTASASRPAHPFGEPDADSNITRRPFGNLIRSGSTICAVDANGNRIASADDDGDKDTLPSGVLDAISSLLATRRALRSSGLDTPTPFPRGEEEQAALVQRVGQQMALAIAIAKGRLDIVELMVGRRAEGTDGVSKTATAPRKRGRAPNAVVNEVATSTPTSNPPANHLGWDPCFTATDNRKLLAAVSESFPALQRFIPSKSDYPRAASSPLPIGFIVDGSPALFSLNALHRACLFSGGATKAERAARLGIVRHLVEVCGVSPDVPTWRAGGSWGNRTDAHCILYPIHLATIAAASSGDVSIIRYLAAAGCDRNARTFVGPVAVTLPANSKGTVGSIATALPPNPPPVRSIASCRNRPVALRNALRCLCFLHKWDGTTKRPFFSPFFNPKIVFTVHLPPPNTRNKLSIGIAQSVTKRPITPQHNRHRAPTE